MVGYKEKISKLLNPHPDSALLMIHSYEDYCEKKGLAKNQVEVSYLFASYFRRVGLPDSAIYYFKKSSKLAEKYDSDRGRAIAYNGLCHVYSKLGRTDEAISNCELCIVYANKIEEKNIEAAAYLSLGQVYMNIKELKQGLLFNLKVDSINKITPVRGDIIGAAYKNLGEVYLEFDDFDQAEYYYLKSKAIYEEFPINQEFFLSHANLHLGFLDYEKGQVKEAQHSLLESYDYFEKIDDKNTLAAISSVLGEIYIDLGQAQIGEKYLREAYELHRHAGNIADQCSVGNSLAKLLVKKNELDAAILLLKENLLYSSEVKNDAIVLSANLVLSEAYEKQGKFALALKHQSFALSIKDSLQLAQNASHIRGLETQYQVSQKEIEIAILTTENELIEKQKSSQKILFYSLIALSSIASLFFFFMFRNRQRLNQKLKEIDKAKSAFFTNISHEFRTPLTLISGPIQEELEDENLTNKKRKTFEMIKRNSDRLLDLVNQTLNLAKIESGSVGLSVSQGELCSLIGAIAEGFSFSSQRKTIDYIIDVSSCDSKVWYDADIIEKVVTNLLSNAVKYTDKGGKISFSSKVRNDSLYLEVKNTGKPLSKDQEDHLFDRFYQVNEKEGGVGVGLALVKNLVSLHGGSIVFENCGNGWLCFKVNMPVNKSAFNSDDIKEELGKSLSENSLIETNEQGGFPEDDLPIMLVVDDNEDVRTYLSSVFDLQFEILQASNGQEGVNSALQHIPDIVISDVMMPVLDGIELCHQLKKNVLSSHIPIVLLTAKTGEESELEGMKSGADDFISKPFSVSLLKSKVESLIENRRKIQNHYKQDEFVKPKKFTSSSSDEKLFDKILSILEENLSNSDFTVELFSSTLGMSRMQLHRKLKAITGLSASEFVRSYRIKVAAKMLKETDKNISEVCYSVGFNDHAYFSKCFKKVFKKTPTEYAKE